MDCKVCNELHKVLHPGYKPSGPETMFRLHNSSYLDGSLVQISIVTIRCQHPILPVRPHLFGLSSKLFFVYPNQEQADRKKDFVPETW